MKSSLVSISSLPDCKLQNLTTSQTRRSSAHPSTRLLTATTIPFVASSIAAAKMTFPHVPLLQRLWGMKISQQKTTAGFAIPDLSPRPSTRSDRLSQCLTRNAIRGWRHSSTGLTTTVMAIARLWTSRSSNTLTRQSGTSRRFFSRRGSGDREGVLPLIRMGEAPVTRSLQMLQRVAMPIQASTFTEIIQRTALFVALTPLPALRSPQSPSLRASPFDLGRGSTRAVGVASR